MFKFNYEIPDDILTKIPDYFWPALAGELVSVCDPFIFDEVDTGIRAIDFLTGTAAWEEAFKATCKKLGMEWLNEYRDKLEWYDSDMFDDRICDLIMSKFVKAEPKSNTAYYKWLIGMEKENEEKPSVAYICDEKACDPCFKGDSRYCYHTTDIKHAANFEEVAPGKFMEKE